MTIYGVWVRYEPHRAEAMGCEWGTMGPDRLDCHDEYDHLCVAFPAMDWEDAKRLSLEFQMWCREALPVAKGESSDG